MLGTAAPLASHRGSATRQHEELATADVVLAAVDVLPPHQRG
jgi:hypothetical protein